MAGPGSSGDVVDMAAGGLDTLQQAVERWPGHWMAWAAMGSGLYISGIDDLGMEAMIHARLLGGDRFLPTYLMAVTHEFSWMTQDAGESALQLSLSCLDEAGHQAAQLENPDYQKWVRDAYARIQRHRARYR
jgi:hypothetical protein